MRVSRPLWRDGACGQILKTDPKSCPSYFSIILSPPPPPKCNLGDNLKNSGGFQVNLSYGNTQAHHTKACHAMLATPRLGLARRGNTRQASTRVCVDKFSKLIQKVAPHIFALFCHGQDALWGMI